MKLGFCPSIGPLDIETILDVTVEWELGEPHLVIDAVSILGSLESRRLNVSLIVRAVNSHDEMLAALTRTTQLLEAAGKAIEDAGWDMDFTHVDGIDTDHIGFATDCENAVSTARAAISNATGAVK